MPVAIAVRFSDDFVSFNLYALLISKNVSGF